MSTSGGIAGATSAIPAGATPIAASSGNQANAAATATLAAAAGKTTWITGFEATASGSTAALAVVLTVTGPAVTLSYVFVFPIGVGVGAFPLEVAYIPPIPGNAVNTAVVVSLPAGGAGNTNAAVTAHGYQL